MYMYIYAWSLFTSLPLPFFRIFGRKIKRKWTICLGHDLWGPSCADGRNSNRRKRERHKILEKKKKSWTRRKKKIFEKYKTRQRSAMKNYCAKISLSSIKKNVTGCDFSGDPRRRIPKKKEIKRKEKLRQLLRKESDKNQSNFFDSFLLSFLYFLVVLSVYTERDPHQSIIAQVFCALWGRLWVILDGGRRRVHKAAASFPRPSQEIWPNPITHSTPPLRTVSTTTF